MSLHRRRMSSVPERQETIAYRILGEDVNVNLRFYRIQGRSQVVARTNPTLNLSVTMPIRDGWEEEIRTNIEQMITCNARCRRRRAHNVRATPRRPIMVENPDMNGDDCIMVAVQVT